MIGWRQLLLWGALTLLSACQDSQHQSRQQPIRMALSTVPLNLDPRFATDATSERINRLLYQRLVEFNDRSMPVPGIATWERITPKHYRFHLTSERASFAHGRMLDAWDVVETYRQVLDPDNGSPKRAALRLISSVDAPDQQTVEFTLEREDPLFPAYLTLDILPADLIRSGHDFSTRPVGSGGFEFSAWPEPGRIQMQRRRDGRLFEMVAVKNPTVRVLKLLRGEVDLLQSDLSPELTAYLRSRDEVVVSQRPGSNFTYLGVNYADPATGNLQVRRAIAYAIDRAAITQGVMRGSARPAESLFPAGHWAGTVLSGYRHDPDKARTLLAELGYTPDHPLRLTYKTSSDPFRVRLATIIQSQLREVGISVQVRSYDWGTFFGDIKQGNFQLYSLTWVGLRTPDIYREIFATDAVPPNGANRGRYSNPRVDAWLDETRNGLDLSGQAERYRHIAEAVHRDLPYIPLWYEDQILAHSRRVTGYDLSSDGNYDGLEQIHLVESPELTMSDNSESISLQLSGSRSVE
ncbi:MAG: ABC transporter substrate-binding protein [Candidatus Thiodiazotropha sp.]